MSVTLRISLCLSTLMFSLLHAHGNVCRSTFEVLIEGPFVSVRMLRIISCKPKNHMCNHELENLPDYSKINIRHNIGRSSQMIWDNLYFNKRPAPFVVLQGDGFVHFRNTFGQTRVERLKVEKWRLVWLFQCEVFTQCNITHSLSFESHTLEQICYTRTTAFY